MAYGQLEAVAWLCFKKAIRVGVDKAGGIFIHHILRRSVLMQTGRRICPHQCPGTTRTQTCPSYRGANPMSGCSCCHTLLDCLVGELLSISSEITEDWCGRIGMGEVKSVKASRRPDMSRVRYPPAYPSRLEAR